MEKNWGDTPSATLMDQFNGCFYFRNKKGLELYDFKIISMYPSKFMNNSKAKIPIFIFFSSLNNYTCYVLIFSALQATI